MLKYKPSAINVTAFTRISDDKTFYDGVYFDKENCKNTGQLLVESSDKSVKPGFFENLEDLVEAIKNDVNEDIKELTPTFKNDYILNFLSKLDPDGEGKIESAGAYLQRPINEKEFRKLLSLADEMIRPMFYEEDYTHHVII